MKKTVIKKTVSIILLVVSIALTGCCYSSFTIESSTLQVVVISCEERNFYLDYNYERLARNHADNYYLHNYYSKLAIENGYSDYSITVIIDDKPYSFIVSEIVEVGEFITIVKEDTYYDGEIIDTDYKLGS